MTGLLDIDTHGPVRIVTMTGKPRRGNPLSEALVEELLETVVLAEQDPTISVMVLAGTETHFSVGADLEEVHQKSATFAVLERWLDELDRIVASQKPIIAAVRGHAVGGGFELALGCDLLVCADDAKLSLPETGIGVIAGQGGTQRLIGLAGRAIATDLILTGRVLSGAEALSLGIAARAVPAANVLDEALGVANAIAARSAPAVRFAREVLREAAEGPLRQSFRIERLLASLVLDTEEKRTRVGAFLGRKGKA